MFKRILAGLFYWLFPNQRPGLTSSEFRHVLRDSSSEEITQLVKMQDYANVKVIDDLIRFMLLDYTGNNPVIETLRKVVTGRSDGTFDLLLVSTVIDGELRVNGYSTNNIADPVQKPLKDTYWIERLMAGPTFTLHYIDTFGYPWNGLPIKHLDRTSHSNYKTLFVDPFAPLFSWSMSINDLNELKPHFA